MLPPLDVVTHDPLNAETPLDALAPDVTPTRGFYVRGHYAIPRVDARDWRLRFEGAFRHPRVLGLDELKRRGSVEITTVLECAGNGRSRLAPLPKGTPWGERAVGCAKFRGARLADLVAECEPERDAAGLVFRGADHDKTRHYERSMPVDALGDAILAWEMNGEPLTPEHGAPVRLVVPGWYGMASVKWLEGIRASREPFRGFFQADEYVIDGKPLRAMRVKSMIVSPAPGATVPFGEITIRGRAWSGAGAIVKVEVSPDAGLTWREADARPQSGPYGWVAWELRWKPSRPGKHVLLARATDSAGNVQPLAPEWNPLGYANHATIPHPLVLSALGAPSSR